MSGRLVAGGALSARWPTTCLLPARRPRRTARVKSSRRRIRCAAGSTPAASGRELGATLAAARGEDASAGAGTHTQAEAVGLRPAAVVRLERTLAHGDLLRCWCVPPGGVEVGHHRTPAPPRRD